VRDQKNNKEGFLVMFDNLQRKFLNLIGIEIEEEDKPQEVSKTKEENAKQKHETPKVVTIGKASQTEVTVYNLKLFDEVVKVCDALRENKIVVFNLEQVAEEHIQRIIDFVSGAVYVLDAKIHKISKKIFVVVPRSIELEVDEQLKEEFRSKGVFAWLK